MQLLVGLCVVLTVSVIEREKKRMTMNDKNLLRRRNGILAGVCSGLGQFFGISPNWFRLAFILMMLPGGIPGILIYLIAWFVIPKYRG